MYPVTELYKNKIKENNRTFEVAIRIEHSQGTLNLEDKDLGMGSLTYTESSQGGEEFTIGGTVASDISFTIFNKPEYSDIEFMGATVFVSIGLFVSEGIDAHFIQPSQPSKMQGFGDVWEYVPLGRFNIDEVKRLKNVIELKAIDNMINLDKSYNLSTLSYPATLQQIYNNICNVADIPIGTLNFPNKDYLVNARPTDDITLRDVLGYVAELSGTFAKCNRNGSLELRWYEETDTEIGPANRFNFKTSGDTVQIKGIMKTVEETTYLAGSEDYAIDLSENPLLQGNYETVLPIILDNVKDTEFIPYESEWQGNPAIQAGDIIKQIDRDGKEYNTLVTRSTYKYRGRSNLEAKGLPEISKGYKGSTNRKLAEIKRKVDVEVGDKLTTLEEQQLQATELIANMLGGHAIVTEDAFYIADNPDIDLAVKVWKWGLGGFGYSKNGVGGPYTTAITAEGSIVAELISAGIITADMVQTGILKSEDGGIWINLDNNEFNLNNQIVYNSTTNRVSFGSGVSLGWGNVTGKPYIPTETYITNITKDTITTSYINALNITARSLNGGTINIGNGTFTVDSNGSVTAGGFHIPHDADGVYNNFDISGESTRSARWMRDADNYIRQSHLDFTVYVGGVGRFVVGSSNIYAMTDVRPFTNGLDLGSSSYRWDNLYVTTGGVNEGSDMRLKNNITDIPQDLLHHFSEEVRPKMFEMNDKIHFGYIAQDVERALYKYAIKKVGLENAREYVDEFNLLGRGESYLSLVYNQIAVMKEVEMHDRIDKLEKIVVALLGDD